MELRGRHPSQGEGQIRHYFSGISRAFTRGLFNPPAGEYNWGQEIEYLRSRDKEDWKAAEDGKNRKTSQAKGIQNLGPDSVHSDKT